jgi:phenylacetyl-CoA:acceptor oxidoreductase 26-kDa subunit
MIRTVEPQRQTTWDYRAALQFISGGGGASLMAFTAVAAWLDPAWLWRTGLVAVGLVCLGLLAVFVKLGRRWRAFLVVLNPFTSWLTREALLAPIVVALGLAAIVLEDRLLGLLAGLVSLAYLYSQARLLQQARGIPAWRIPAMSWLICATGLAEGSSMLLIGAAIFGSPGAWLPLAFGALIGVRLAVWHAYRRVLSAPGAAPTGTVHMLSNMQAPVLVGHGAALVLLLLGLLLPALAPILALAAGLAGLLSGWHLKFGLVVRAAYTQGFALARTPARTPGYSGPGVKPGWEPGPEHGA